MDRLENIRSQCFQTIQLYEELDREFANRIDQAKKMREKNVSQVLETEKYEKALSAAYIRRNKQTEQAAALIISELKLKPDKIVFSTVNTPASQKELAELITTQNNVIIGSLHEIQLLAKQLKEENKKWWKFW